MKLVRAALKTDLQEAARRAAILCVCAIADDLRVAECLRRRANDKRSLVDEVDHGDVVVNAIQQEGVFAGRTHAVGSEAAAERVTSAGFSRLHAGCQNSQESKRALPT